MTCTNDLSRGIGMGSEFRSLQMFHFVMEKMSDTFSNDVNLENFKVKVKNFGPIESANVDLKPLTVFVGKSNTGKTYLATLIYALHQELGGFPRLPYSPKFNTENILQTWRDQNDDFQKSVTNFESQLTETSKNLNFSNLPPIFSSMLFVDSTSKDNIQKQLIESILVAFGEKNIYSLCRKSGTSNRLLIEFGYSLQNSDIWHAEIKGSKFKTSFEASPINDIPVSDDIIQKIGSLFALFTIGTGLRNAQYSLVARVIEMLSYPKTQKPNQVYYLPAVRGGIMQSHRFVASAGLDQLSYVDFEGPRAIPHLPKTSIDFIKNLLSISGKPTAYRQAMGNHKRNTTDSISSIAEQFERLILDGRIESHNEFVDGYPEIYFRPDRINSKFTLSRSSSMVSELAPIVLFVRNFVRQSDLLILEEPEAHLHPGAQIKIAECLALLVRKGVNVIVTTHSDWFLKCIQNLIIQGKLKQLNIDNSGDEATSYLHRNEVGAWNFTEGINNRGTKVKKIKFHEDSGIEPEDFEDLAFSLYNSVIGGRNLIASKEFSEGGSMGNANEPDIELKKMFTPSDIATRLSVNVERVRRKLKQFGVKPVKGYRFFFDKQEFDILCERIADEIGLNKLAQ